MMDVGPVHWLENVDGDPHRLRTACGYTEWTTESTALIDHNRKAVHEVTCPGCLAAMADTPVIVKVT